MHKFCQTFGDITNLLQWLRYRTHFFEVCFSASYILQILCMLKFLQKYMNDVTNDLPHLSREYLDH